MSFWTPKAERLHLKSDNKREQILMFNGEGTKRMPNSRALVRQVVTSGKVTGKSPLKLPLDRIGKSYMIIALCWIRLLVGKPPYGFT